MFTKRILLTASLAAVMASCSIEKKESAKLPEVEVDVEEGNMPEYEVDWADIDVKTSKKTVKVPKVMVVMEEKEVDVPYIDFQAPNNSGSEENTIDVSVEVKNEGRDISIEEVYLHKNKLYVVSELEKTGENLADKKMKVSDRLIVNLPEDKNLKVEHYIIGSDKDIEFDNNYVFIDSKENLPSEISDAKKLI